MQNTRIDLYDRDCHWVWKYSVLEEVERLLGGILSCLLTNKKEQRLRLSYSPVLGFEMTDLGVTKVPTRRLRELAIDKELGHPQDSVALADRRLLDRASMTYTVPSHLVQNKSRPLELWSLLNTNQSKKAPCDDWPGGKGLSCHDEDCVIYT